MDCTLAMYTYLVKEQHACMRAKVDYVEEGDKKWRGRQHFPMKFSSEEKVEFLV